MCWTCTQDISTKLSRWRIRERISQTAVRAETRLSANPPSADIEATDNPGHRIACQERDAHVEHSPNGLRFPEPPKSGTEVSNTHLSIPSPLYPPGIASTSQPTHTGPA